METVQDRKRPNDIVSFLRKKDFLFLDYLRNGGLGETVILLDQEMQILFVCKKYQPHSNQIKEKYYQYFKNEIKLMFQLYHPNIVRIFNYYLYPEQTTGYILMEYIDGEDIYTYLKKNPERINSVFEQVIEAFVYLESNNILHRDIRINNILVNFNGQVKVIDFGFGKTINYDNDCEKSISLNWWCDKPYDFTQNIYSHKTEIYFVGKLFEQIGKYLYQEKIFYEFRYESLLSEMIRLNPSDRIQSFSDIKEKILKDNNQNIEFFTDEEKKIYKNFIDALVTSIAMIDKDASYTTDIDIIIQKIQNIYTINQLENEVQNISDVIRTFISGRFRYYPQQHYDCYLLKNFINLLKNSNNGRKNIILLNIHNRLNQIEHNSIDFFDPVPF
ncbi:protein kinase family protein [Treponema vincentii]|uniref:protein kinase family protein n=1 Tax=Treponema TaxID=157 RepID=UPI001BAEB521|nr:protein kinase family protein [Treponema vincentii]QUY17226.1 protein kinase family protein [Treponema vincentii]